MNELLYKAKQFFVIDHTLGGTKMKLASIHFNGKTLHWFLSFLRPREREIVLLWSEFKEALVARFRKQLLEYSVAELKNSNK